MKAKAYVGTVLLLALVALGCPAQNVSIIGLWDCTSYAPSLDRTDFSEVYFYANGDVRIHFPLTGNTYTLSYSFNGEDIVIFGEDTFLTTGGLVVISQTSNLTLSGRNRITGETWQTISVNGGDELVVYTTEAMERR